MATVPRYRSLYAQVLAGITLGIVVGLVAPETGAAMRSLGDGFIKLIRGLYEPDRQYGRDGGHRQMGQRARSAEGPGDAPGADGV